MRDINPGTGSAYPYNFTAVNGTVVFGANDGTTGYEALALRWHRRGHAAGFGHQPGR